jgi:hypothetical protein
MIKNKSEVQTYNESIDISDKKLKVESHWNSRDIVRIEIKGQFVFVDGRELKIAIDNCMNVR